MYDMGMKVAAVSVMCQDERVFEAMLNAGTPCPKDGLVGDKARLAWEMEAVEQTIEREQNNPMRKIFNENVETKTGLGVIISYSGLLTLQCDPYSYGTTGNAASTALSWGMSSVLPDIPGLDINGFLYRYTTVKNPEDNMKVHVGNK